MSSPVAMLFEKHLDFSPAVAGGTGIVGDGLIGFGASYALGQVHHRYGDRWVGRNASRLVGIIGKGIALAATAFGAGDPGVLGSVADVLGQAGVNMLGAEMGLRHARASTGKRAVLMPAGAALPAGAREVTIGELGEAPAGRALSWDAIEDLATSR